MTFYAPAQASIEQYLNNLGLPASRIRIQKFPHGQSNPTYLIVLDDGRKLVLRRKPPGALLQSAHAVDREFLVMRALGAHNFPVAPVVALCEDPQVAGTPFYLAEHVSGTVFTDPSLPTLAPQERQAVYRQLAGLLGRLHALDPVALGLGSYGKAQGYCARQVRRWAQQYEASVRFSGTGAPQVEMERLIHWLGEESWGKACSDPLIQHPRACARVCRGERACLGLGPSAALPDPW